MCCFRICENGVLGVSESSVRGLLFDSRKRCGAFTLVASSYSQQQWCGAFTLLGSSYPSSKKCGRLTLVGSLYS